MAGTNIEAQPTNLQGVGLVRNSEGQPQFNDFTCIPEAFHPLLTEDDWIYISSKLEEDK